MSLGYAGVIGLIYQRDRGQTLLKPLASAGQMALTNYIGQSIICVFIFYSFGTALFGRLEPYAATLVAMTLYASQLAFSTWWMRRFRFGPLEWLWRSLTYEKNQPMRRTGTPA